MPPTDGPPAGVPADFPSVPSRAPMLQRMHPVAFALFSLAVVFFLYQFVAGGLTLLVAGTDLTIANVALVRWSTIIGQVVFILVPTVVLARLRGRNLLEFFRFRVPDVRQIVLAIIATFALQQVLQGYMTLQDMIPLPQEIQKILDTVKKLFEEAYRVLVIANSPGEFIFVLLVVALVPALAEEMLFRGLVQRSLEDAAGGLRGALITGVIFGVYHLIPTNVVPLAILGMFLGFLVYRSQNIILSMSAHFFNNLVACLAIYLRLDEDFVVIAPGGNASGAQLVVNCALFAVVFVGATAYFVRLTRRVSAAHPVNGASLG